MKNKNIFLIVLILSITISGCITCDPLESELRKAMKSPPENDCMSDHVNWWYLKNEINSTHAWLNMSYRDIDNKTIFIEYWINDTDNNNWFYINQTYPCSNGVYTSNNIVNAANCTYLVHLSATHPDYPSLK